MRFLLAKTVGLVSSALLRWSPFSGGSAAPGLIALKIDPDFVAKYRACCQSHIVVSGTNGKTTTTRMLSAIFESQKVPHIHNRTGSNLLRGIASTFLEKIGFSAALTTLPVGLWEVDEAALPEVLLQLKPSLVVLTNLFRDQLDRYGEIDSLAKKWRQALSSLGQNASIILNGDDASLIDLGTKLKQPVIFYGIAKTETGSQAPAHAADATFCPRCLKPLNYAQVFYSHLGAFSCSCGFRQPKKALEAKDIKLKTTGLSFKVKTQKETVPLSLTLSGLFNVYNALAALAVAYRLKLNLSQAAQALASFKPAFGRMETVTCGSQKLEILLVKNPTGFNQIITNLIQRPTLPLLVIAINDNFADGTDVSWLWDVDFETLAKKAQKIIVTGRRAWDMALRLKYAGFPTQKLLKVTPDLEQALNHALETKINSISFLPTYTAMLDLRQLLVKKGLVTPSWQD